MGVRRVRNSPLGLDVPVNQPRDGRAERLLLVRADPDEEPVVELYTGGEDSADTGAGADGDAAAVQVRQVGQASKLGRTRP